MQTAVDYLIEQLQAPCRGIPSHIIEQAKQMEKEQIINDHTNGQAEYDTEAFRPKVKELAEQYYNETYLNK